MGVSPMPAFWLALGSLAGFLGGYLLRPGWRDPILATGLGFVLAIMVRVALEVAADPTSHNLWPFEVVIAGFFGLISGVIGVAIARGAQRLTASR